MDLGVRFKLGFSVHQGQLAGQTDGVVPKVFIVRSAKVTTSNRFYKCFTAWKDVSGPFSIRAEGTI